MTNSYESIYRAHGMLQAVLMQNILGSDGIPSILIHSSDPASYLQVGVPAWLAAEVRAVLNPEMLSIETFECNRQA